ncbi:aspartate kinase [Candidatus Pacearchaeota archaeon]|nr:aspartate kinase [Candidatus Pacearchaeota archaeon]
MERALLNRVQDEYMYLDGFISYGEIINSHIATAALRKNGANARLYMPGDIGAVTDGKFGQARLLPSSYDSMKTALRAALARDELIVLPGFFAVDSLDRFTTLGRGASDIIGSHVAHAVDAEIYENWTDQNGILTAHPDVVENPQTIGRLTYREARELAISGAKILHQDTLSPLISKGIPLNVRNTFNPPHSGTYIGPTKEPNGHVVEGIAHKTDFAVIYLEKIGIEGEVGYLSRVTDIFARHGLPIERSPDSSDSLALIVPQNKGANKYKIKAVVREIEENGLVDSEVNVQYDRGLICVVGEGMRYASGVLAKVTGALASAGINIETCIQGPSQRNITLGLHPNDVHRAVRAIHNAYFGNSRQPQYAAQHAAI